VDRDGPGVVLVTTHAEALAACPCRRAHGLHLWTFARGGTTPEQSSARRR